MQLRLVHTHLGAPDFRGGRSRGLDLQLVSGAHVVRIASLVERNEHSYSDTIHESVIEAKLYRVGPKHLRVDVVWEEDIDYVGSSRSVKHHESVDGGQTWRRATGHKSAEGLELLHCVARNEAVDHVE